MKTQARGLILLAVLLASAPAMAERAPLPDLRIGSPAPALKVAKWFKGTPVEQFKPGEIYVVEFWATWCGPCINAMPHITELAKKYEGKLTVIGVSVWERTSTDSNDSLFNMIGAFVEKQGERMRYNVAAEGIDKPMAETWMKAAGRTGIPCTMIIGRDGNIAWIGHPMQMEESLAQLVDDKYDIKLAAAEYAKKWEEDQDRKELLEPVTTALRTHDDKAMIAAVDQAVAKLPDIEPSLFPLKFEALLKTDEPAAYAYMTTVSESELFAKHPITGYNFWIAMKRHAGELHDPQWSKLADILGRAVKEQPTIAQYLLAQADALDLAGRIDEAIAAQQRVIEIGTPLIGKEFSEEWLQKMKDRLAEYEAKKKN
jgi:thiol-disulfide isomerase/thioredoxin